MIEREWNLRFLTPCFTGGIDAAQRPSLRASGFRGQLRWWLRALTNDRCVEEEVFGGIGADNGEDRRPRASSVILRLKRWNGGAVSARALPHSEDPRKQFRRPALEPERQFTLQLSLRPGFDERSFGISSLVLDIYSLLGSFGFRSNRGSGSVWPVESSPKEEGELRDGLVALRRQCMDLGLWRPDSRLARAHVSLQPDRFESAEEARAVCSDTVRDSSGALGYVDGSRRMASPLKLKVVRFRDPDPCWAILRIGFPERYLNASSGLDLLQQRGKRAGAPGITLL